MVTSRVCSSVWIALIISTSFITGTGLKKCIPITCCGRFVTDAIFVIDIEEVFEARIACGAQTASSFSKIDLVTPLYRFNSKLS